MDYSLSILFQQFEELKNALESPDGNERAAYLFCSRSSTSSEEKLIVNEWVAVEPEDILNSSKAHISIQSRSFVQALAKADKEGKSLVFVHTHPKGYNHFSKQDDTEESSFFRTAYTRAPAGLHGSLIIVNGEIPELIGRVWLSESESIPFKKIRVVGKRFIIFDGEAKQENFLVEPWADRQIRAFGKEAQRLLTNLRIGVVGAGGTGSSVCEQLIRLGVGEITVIDDQKITDTNITRVYGSRLSDVNTPKVEVIQRLANDIGLGTKINSVFGNTSQEATVKKLLDCDLIFCCTDDFVGRNILNKLAIWYYIPVIDLAVAIDSQEGTIREVVGRVTNLIPGNACLKCRERITEQLIRAQTLYQTKPEEYQRQIKEGYIPELGEPDPSIVMFTTGIASRAVIEFMQMITGFMENDRTATELLERYHELDIRKNSLAGREDCLCTTPSKWGKGDQKHFLEMLW